MGLDIKFYKRSKLDPRYKTEIGNFIKVNCILKYFVVGEDDNCNNIVIPKEKFEQFKDDLKKELGSHKGTCIPTGWYNETVLEPINENLRTKQVFFGGNTEYNGEYWDDIRALYRFTIKAMKEIEWDKDDLILVCWW